MTIALDLGCGDKPKNPFNAKQLFGVDIRDDLSNNIIKCDFVIEPLPFPDEFFDYISCFDVIEHVPRIIYNPTRRLPFIELMNEVYRCLKLGGAFLSSTPAFPSPTAFQDPTHVNFITEKTFLAYFDKRTLWARGYGFKGQFIVTAQDWQDDHLVTRLEKV
jgi:SAM-dependent methyltransferase